MVALGRVRLVWHRRTWRSGGALGQFEFQYIGIENLPILSWAAEIVRGNQAIIVRHGLGVETAIGRFFEGAWSGDLSGSFTSAFSMTGTGGIITARRVVFATPTNT